MASPSLFKQDNIKAVIDGHDELPSEVRKGTPGQAPQPSAVTRGRLTGTTTQASQRAQVLPDPLGNELGMQRICVSRHLTPVRQVLLRGELILRAQAERSMRVVLKA